MHLVGQPSWSLRQSSGGSVDALLYVRDALGLPVGPDDPPARTALAASVGLPEEVARTAAEAWQMWWRGEVDRELGLHDGDRRRTALPVDAAALTDPVLRRAAVELWPAAQRWTSQRADLGTSRLREAVPHALVERTAHDVAFDTGVPLDRVQAHLLAVDCPGVWSRPWAPGVVVCSPGALADPATAWTLLHRAFRSAVVG